MAINRSLPRPREHVCVEAGGNFIGQLVVIDTWPIRLQGMKKHALLRRRSRIQVLDCVPELSPHVVQLVFIDPSKGKRSRRDGGRLRNLFVGKGGLLTETGCNSSHGMVLKHEFWIQLEAGAMCLGNDLETENRISAQIKKIVVDTHAIQMKHLGPDLRKRCFAFVPRRNIDAALRRLCLALVRKGRSVDLAVGGQWKCVQHRNGCRNHRLRQTDRQAGSN